MTETLSEYLTRTKTTSGVVTQEQFAQSRENLGGYASWAIWGETTDDLSFFDEDKAPWTRLRSDVFFLGGNTGLFNDGALTTFSNFHTAGHGGDTRLKNTLTGTPLEGAYFTDIVKNDPTTGSAALRAKIKAGEIDLLEKVFQPLQRERELLGSPAEVILILLGKGTSEVWADVVAHPSLPDGFLDGIRIIEGINHYTAPAPFNIEVALDGPSPL